MGGFLPGRPVLEADISFSQCLGFAKYKKEIIHILSFSALPDNTLIINEFGCAAIQIYVCAGLTTTDFMLRDNSKTRWPIFPDASVSRRVGIQVH